MDTFSEETLENDMVEKFQQKGWRFVPASELERDSLEEPLLFSSLIRSIKKINSGSGLGNEEIKQVIDELKFLSGNEGTKKILAFFKSGVPVKFEKERVLKLVQLFDYDTLENNDFIISRQMVYKSGDSEIRTDIMLYVNGIPLVNLELKDPTSFSQTWYDAYSQIKYYEKEIPELYKYVQIGVAAEQTARYFPIVSWQEEVKNHLWREGSARDDIDAIIEMLTPERLLDIIRNYIFYRVEMGEATKVIARYMQYRASEKIVQRVLNNLEGIEDKKKGLIWHWQGSGKTLTMIFAANKLYHQKQLENPTIFFIVDRNELEDQLRDEFFSLDIIEPEIIGSINELKRVLEYDDGRGKRGILITLIHKFRPDELRDFQIELEEQSKKKETIQNRKNVIAFIDEGHRTQYGTLAGQMKSILKNSFFFALTGTPISKEGRDTYKEYSYPPEETYLDRYFITDSIKDGFTVKIAYQPRLEKEVHLKKEMLDVFLSVGLEEIPVDIKDEVEERVKKKLNHINMFLEDEKRIQIVARDIAKHFKENVDGKFKAMVVTATRKACARYKSALDSYLPENYSEIVMSYNKKKDQEIIQLAVREARGRYGDEDYDDIKKGVVGRFKEEEYPKILIVTEMLLAGFDAPVLQTMYLDKPLKEHRLLQAIARTNRPYKDVKEAGLIIDYVGILKEIKKAFEKYGREYRGVIDDFESLKREFIDLINEIMELLQDVPKDQYDRETLLKAVAVLTTNEDDTRKFLENYRTLRKLFELLGPSEIKIELLSEYRWISAIYTYYMKTVRSETDSEKYIQKYFEKTVRYVHETIEFETLEKNLPIIEFNEEYLKNLQEKIESKEEKAANIVFTLNRYVLVEKHDNPIYETLTDKIERILELWKQKTKDFEQIYLEGYGAIEELNRLGRRQKELGFTNMEYSLLLALEDRFGKEEELVEDVRQLSKKLEKYMFTGWTVQPTERKKVQQAVRRFIRRYIRRYGLTHTGLNELYDKLIKNVENYGRKK